MTCRCACLTGVCFACGLRCDHGAKNCPRPALFSTPKHFCIRCKLPVFELADVTLHSSSCIGNECPNAALADQVKMLLLAGRAAGEAFGPASFEERVKWATEGSPPNLIDVIARVASQTKRSATPGPAIETPVLQLTPEQRERIRANREAALQRKKESSQIGLPLVLEMSPSASQGAVFLPFAAESSTPQTHPRPNTVRAASTLQLAIANAVPSVRTTPPVPFKPHDYQLASSHAPA